MRRILGIVVALAVLALFAWWKLRPQPPLGTVGAPRLSPPEVASFPRRKPGVAAAAKLPVQAAPAAPVPEQKAAPSRIPKPEAALKLLEDVLAKGNDNDPRLDRDFNDLSPQAKHLFRQKYGKLPAEYRNDKGIIVFLLGRKNLRTDEDWAFLRSVVSEPACLSLQDCSKPMPADDSQDTPGLEVTLAYPQLVALDEAQKALAAQGAAARQAKLVVQAAKSSPVPLIAAKAAALDRRF